MSGPPFLFHTSTPVSSAGFVDRLRELSELAGHVRKLVDGAPSWVALLGPRKIGKTSLLLELSRRSQLAGVVFVILDSFEEMPVSRGIFRRYALRALDAALGNETGESLEAAAARPTAYRALLQQSTTFGRLPPALRAQILELCDAEVSGSFLRECLELPERLGKALGCWFVVAWDEFQELTALSGRGEDVLALARSIWQKHARVGYVVSGSARAMLRELVTAERSPFFQHFAILELGGFAPADALALLARAAPSIPVELAEKMVGLTSGHPFYLQLLGEGVTSHAPPLDDGALKHALQELLFSRTGRLALYFEGEFQRLVGRSTFLAAVLRALAHGPMRLGELAAAIASPSGATVKYLERLGDAVQRRGDGLYVLDDPTFGLWLRWREPGGTVIPMKLVGDEAEIAVAEELARLRFDLVYQSRASRGAFDLLATRGDRQLGVQVKRSPLPLSLGKAAWARMAAEARRFGWAWVVASVTPEGVVRFLDPARARGASLGAPAVIENLLLWLDQARAREVELSRAGAGARRGPAGPKTRRGRR